MSFSNGVRLSQLNDFLLPEQDCIKPVSFKKRKNLTSKAENDIDSSQKSANLLNADSSIKYEVMKESENAAPEQAQVNLADCLACSGCVTTSEAVLVNLQSFDQVLNRLSNPEENQIVIFTISPQTVASFSVKYNLSTSDTKKLLDYHLKKSGAHYVLDLNFARSLMQLEAANEFISHKKNLSSLPLISSWCPGVVCYAEKSQHLLVNSFSKVKSPMQIMASFVKAQVSNSYLFSSSNIYHVAVMPCFDKKLEASRPEFSTDNQPSSRLVDIVISTSELDSLFTSLNVEFNKNTPEISNSNATNQTQLSNFSLFQENDDIQISPSSPSNISHTGSAGGTLEFVLQAAAKSLHSLELPISDLNGQTSNPLVKISYSSRNKSKDYKEISISIPGSEDTLVGVAVYGFRHLQTLIRKLKSKSCKNYDYVEVAACPGACGNGGGQLKPLLEKSDNIKNPLPKSLSNHTTSLVELAYSDSDLSYLPSNSSAIPKNDFRHNLLPSFELHNGLPILGELQNHPNYSNHLELLYNIKNTSEFKKFYYTDFQIVESNKDKLITNW
ncbi:Cytosolic Fe-S cluster assembly factor NARFL [Smittium culicis]|uniref:Cytosolic Fe-S cluster assembly factor NARFL n=1 Tax=Smittium culicis TaxID=133412 RepID=A0A1R1YFR8_9FUNG|nr:Cytosolic Fe-S cluster assembly factor NARFL [Smittium culicis]